MDRRELLAGLAGVMALGGRAVWAGHGDPVEGEGFFFRRGSKVTVFKQLRMTTGPRDAVELRLGTGRDALVLKGRLTRGGGIELTEGPGVASRRSGYVTRGASERPAVLTVGEATDPDFYLAFISDEALGDALVDTRSDARGTLKRPSGREVDVLQSRVLITDRMGIVKLRTTGGEGGDQWFIGNARRRGDEYQVSVHGFFRNPGELQQPAGAGTVTVQMSGRRLRRIDVMVPTDRGRLTGTVRVDRD